MKRERVIVGLSGGVDSSVTALLLLRDSYDVIGAFIRSWHPPFWPCTEEQDRLDAMRAASHIGIPFITIDARKEYEEDVARVLIDGYRNGRTPNPDMLCNRMVKFAVLDRVREQYDATYVATGHYARIHMRNGTHLLARAHDTAKDQSYFLASLTRDMLSRIVFPLGTYTKTDVRVIAKKARLPNADRKDSQGICFLGAIDMRTFLSKYIDVTPGSVLDEDGRSIGTHEGAALYTIGERHGFHISAHTMNEVPRYIVEKDVVRNTLTVSTHPPQYALGDSFKLSSWNPCAPEVEDGTYDAVLRYHANAVAVSLHTQNDLRSVTLQSATERPSIGQTCVLYRGDEVVASGIIER